MRYATIITIIVFLTGCGSLVPKTYTIADCESLEAHQISQCKFDTLGEFFNGNTSVNFTVENCEQMGVKDDSVVLGCKRHVSNINNFRTSQQAQAGMNRLNQFQQTQLLYNFNNILQRY